MLNGAVGDSHEVTERGPSMGWHARRTAGYLGGLTVRSVWHEIAPVVFDLYFG
jgi:hypothetical protein